MSKLDLRKHYLQLAYDQLNPRSNSIESLQQVLVNWFCFKFNTTPNDQRLLGMRLDELLLLRMMNEIHDRPSVVEEIGSQGDEYEEWLKREMGDSYKSADQMVSDHERLEEEEKILTESLPERVITDFNSVRGE